MRSSLKEEVRWWLHHRGVHLGGASWSVRGKRATMLRHHGIRTMFDVGGNVGQYATEIRRSGFDGDIYSYEPLSGPFRTMVAAAARDPRWHPVQTAVGSSAGQITVHISKATKFSSVLPNAARNTDQSPEAEYVGSEDVAVQRLDDLVAEAKPGAGEIGVKIDVQGFERDVMDGATETLKRARFLEMELTPRQLYEGQMLMMEALARTEDLGFELSTVENIYASSLTGRSWQFNGIFIRP
jgi:FkbM family methyltransferase